MHLASYFVLHVHPSLWHFRAQGTLFMALCAKSTSIMAFYAKGTSTPSVITKSVVCFASIYQFTFDISLRLWGYFPFL
jgi:hypothetical protein